MLTACDTVPDLAYSVRATGEQRLTYEPPRIAELALRPKDYTMSGENWRYLSQFTESELAQEKWKTPDTWVPASPTCEVS